MKKVLIIDDNEQNRLLVKLVLEQNGYQVIEAESGVDGIRKAIDHLPDLIILDIMMPQVSGWEVMEVLKENTATKKIPVVVLTALDQIGDLEADGYLQKPLDVARLLETVAEAVKWD
ncbi:MAG: response regulator [Aquificae bacterium]|nr:response regulator [Aquificota bacterium]